MAIGLNSEILFHVFKAYFLDTVLTLGSLDSVHFQEEWKKKFCCLYPLAQKQKQFVELVIKKKNTFFSEVKHE